MSQVIVKSGKGKVKSQAKIRGRTLSEILTRASGAIYIKGHEYQRRRLLSGGENRIELRWQDGDGRKEEAAFERKEGGWRWVQKAKNVNTSTGIDAEEGQGTAQRKEKKFSLGEKEGKANRNAWRKKCRNQKGGKSPKTNQHPKNGGREPEYNKLSSYDLKENTLQPHWKG